MADWSACKQATLTLMQAGRQAGRQVSQQASKQARKEASRQASKRDGRHGRGMGVYPYTIGVLACPATRGLQCDMPAAGCRAGCGVAGLRA
jgi:hypothetical protein